MKANVHPQIRPVLIKTIFLKAEIKGPGQTTRLRRLICILLSACAPKSHFHTARPIKYERRNTDTVISLHNLYWNMFFFLFFTVIQSNLVISNSLISNNRLSRSENLVPVLT